MKVHSTHPCRASALAYPSTIIFTLALLCSVATAFAECAGGNLVRNCSFEAVDADWQVVSGFASSSNVARSGSLSLRMDSEEVLAGIAYDTELHQCVEVAGDTIYSAGLFARTVSGSASCWPRVSWHSNSTCSSFLAIDSYPAEPVASMEWTLVAEDKTSPSAARSGRLDIVCTAGAHFMVLLDDVFLVNGPIFDDGFENGTTAWSTVVD